MECISLCGIPCLCALSASAFIDSSLHQLDFFFRNLFMETCVNLYGIDMEAILTNWCNNTVTTRSQAIQSCLFAKPKTSNHAHWFRSHRCHVMGQQVHDWMEKHLTCKCKGRLCKETLTTVCYQVSQGWISLWWGRKRQMQGWLLSLVLVILFFISW